jgi:hypothetical protein
MALAREAAASYPRTEANAPPLTIRLKNSLRVVTFHLLSTLPSTLQKDR